MQTNTSLDRSNFIGKLSSPESVQDRMRERHVRMWLKSKGKSVCNLDISEGTSITLELKTLE